MTGETKKLWIEFCEQAAQQQDPKKLIALVNEINRLLQERGDRLNNSRNSAVVRFPEAPKSKVVHVNVRHSVDRTYSRRLRTDAAMCAFRINELGQHPAEILLLGRHGEEHTLCAHVPVESLDIGNGETQLDFSRWVFVGSRVQRESGFSRYELAPARRLELEFETEHITIELHGFAHVSHELDHVSKLCSLHLNPPLYDER
jgi:hypothetical protein